VNFELSTEQEDIQRAASEFAKGEFDPDVALEMDQDGRFPESIWRKACRLGFVGLHYPEEYGGQGLGFLENVLVIEAFCRVDSGIGAALSMADLGAEILIKFSSDEQKKWFLPPLAKGEKRLSLAFAESEDGRDISSISTVAEKRLEKYVIRGRKKFVLNASLADAFIVLCKEPNEGSVTLIVEKEREGIEVRTIEKMGLRMIPFGDLKFKDVSVPYESRLGNRGEGILHVEHGHKALGLRGLAQALGTAQGAFDRAMLYAKQREQFGRKLSQFQVIRHKLADMAASIEVARWLTYKSAIDYDQGETASDCLPIAQLEVKRRMVGVVDEALQIFGGYGYIAEHDIEHYFRDEWAIGVNLGKEESLKDTIVQKKLSLDPHKS